MWGMDIPEARAYRLDRRDSEATTDSGGPVPVTFEIESLGQAAAQTFSEGLGAT